MSDRGWRQVECGCCAGVKWGGEYPVECDRCGGGGMLWLTPSGTRLAQWPGGPFVGRHTAAVAAALGVEGPAAGDGQP